MFLAAKNPACRRMEISPIFPHLDLLFGQSPADAPVQIIDTATDKIVRSISTDLGAQSVHITPLCTIMVGKYSFDPEAPATAPRARAGRSALYSADMYALLGEAVVELAPLTMRSTVDGKTAFVANIFSGTVTIVDLTSMMVIRTLTMRPIRPRNPTWAHIAFHQSLEEL